ncbi:hypothetical protein SAY87_019620 [Trapa incisa]|uniref:mitogen-activated protein kinase kinase kinase n=1 Tax=Trapa incisa TaxID=236973 RepID=A0AAN7K2J9_9MYRT|nr:hypothetical protein SAY87_019620 [Trapa incisa]
MNLFSKNNTTGSGSSRGNRRPRLDRRNARHYDNEAAASSFPDVSTSPFTSLGTPSLLSVDVTNFRINGDEEDQLELIINRFGLECIDDLSIPQESWESRKIRLSSDLLPMSGLNRLFSPRGKEEAENDGVAPDNAVVLDKKEGYREVVDGVALPGGTKLAELNWYRSPSVNEWVQSDLDELQTVTEMVESPNQRTQQSAEVNEEVPLAAELNEDRSLEVNRIKLPDLKPPPSIKVPDTDCELSTWYLHLDVAPAFGPGQEVVAVHRLIEEKGEMDEEGEGDDRWLKFPETVGVSSPCSFTTTTNDEDCSSTSTEPKSTNISPNGKPKKVITTWEKFALLGRGYFGSVYEAISHDGSFFAVKEVSLLDQGPEGKKKILQLEHEIALLSRFEHENIVQYYGTSKDDSNLYIFIEIMKDSLAKLYSKCDLKDSQISVYTRQILQGLKYLHDQNVVHRDIKCANILVDASGYVKLADFGLAKATMLNDIKSCKGTPFWMAPEVVTACNHGGYGLPADIWSLGCTVLEMFIHEIPYHPLESMQAVYRIGKGIPPPVPDTLSHDARDFILKCLQVNPEDRPTAAELLRHPFVDRSPPSKCLGYATPGPHHLFGR